MSANRTYSKKEISKILNKASEIQTQKDLYGDKDGLNEEELLTVANEVGIDKESLLEALQGLENPSYDLKFNWLTGTSRVQDISFANGEITPENWDEIIQEIRKINGGIGKTSKIGSSFEWEQRMREIGYKHISFTPKDGKTKIQYVSGWSGMKLLLSILPIFFGFIFTLIFLKGIGNPKDTAVLFAPIGGLLGFGLGRIFLKSYFENQKMQIKSLLQAVKTKIQSSSVKSRITIEEGAYNSDSESSSSSSKVTS